MIDVWLTRYRRKGYNCSNFAAEVLGVPVETVAGVMTARKAWRPIKGPQEGALCLLRRNAAPPHVGICTKGGVLHLGERVAMWHPMHIVRRDFNNLRFYAQRNNHN